MGRNRAIPDYPDWRVTTTPTGRWVIVDQDGNDVFRHPDRLERLHAVYLASQAGALRAAVEELTRIVENLSTGGHGYRPLLEFSYLTIRFSKPPAAIVAQVEPSRHQQDFDAEAA